jgi:hypothetical protein
MGRTRAGLEVWLAKQETLELPELLVDAARSLADEVDREPEAVAVVWPVPRRCPPVGGAGGGGDGVER